MRPSSIPQSILTRSSGPVALLVALALVGALAGSPRSHADNSRLNKAVVQMVTIVQYRESCPTAIKVNPQLQLAAQWHTADVLNHRWLDGDAGSDGSSPQDRATAAGYHGTVEQTVAINPALAISGVELINQWYANPGYLTTMRNCANTEIGVWSENRIDRTVVVAVYGQPSDVEVG
ncbi:CAP domain-containing protein [Mycobacterium sp. smrl_JER01]|uniref:CAP domain-containing protein n=1 Tax=Mycobacterium sp. smrl_JER01 TaxID=3402633 RepID=UPI003ACD8290